MITRLIFVVVTTVAIIVGYHEYIGESLGIFGQICHRRHHYPFHFMATKTPYLDKGLDEEAALGDPFRTYHGGSCQAIMTWHLIRHGTRNPGSKIIRMMKELLPRLKEQILEGHKNGKGNLCEEELEELRAWSSFPLPEESNEKILVPQGQKELIGISQRFQQRFPDLFRPQYDSDSFRFKFTKTQRAEDSAKHFAKGIFDDSQLKEVYYPTAQHADPVIRFYKDCKKWKVEVDKNPEAYQERMKFETSKIFNQVIGKIQARLGLEKPPTLEEVEIMHLTCSFESAWNPSKPSAWCHVFDEFDFKVLEYRQDVEYYWVDGYGYNLTYRIACPTIQDIVKNIGAKIEDPSSPSVIAYFTHSGTLLKVIARLGLFNDSVPLLGDNFEYHQTSRKWRTSIIDPFATNLAFVLYKCSEDHKVALMFKEKPISQPLCDGKYLCPVKEYFSALEPITKNCDVPGLCRL